MSVIENYTSNKKISGTNSNDYIYNEGDFVKITAGNGNDTIDNEVLGYAAGGSKVKINGGAGNDSITNDGDNSTLNGGLGNDYIENWALNTFISGDKGNDKIYSCGSNVTIAGNAGNDNIWNGGYYDSNGYYSYSGSNVLFSYKLGDGNDKIYGFNETSTLSIGGGSYSKKKIGDNVIVTVGTGKISLMGAASLSSVNIKGTKSGGSTSSTTLIVTDKTKSTVTVSSAIKIINASSRTKTVKITGTSLANTIKGGSNKDTIYGGKGNDSILGNAGNDKLFGGDGNDTILDYEEGKDRIKLNSGFILDVSYKKKDLVFTVGGGTISVKNGKGKKITITDTLGKTTSKIYKPLQSVPTEDEVINKLHEASRKGLQAYVNAFEEVDFKALAK